jgi:hypothetical protein
VVVGAGANGTAGMVQATSKENINKVNFFILDSPGKFLWPRFCRAWRRLLGKSRDEDRAKDQLGCKRIGERDGRYPATKAGAFHETG